MANRLNNLFTIAVPGFCTNSRKGLVSKLSESKSAATIQFLFGSTLCLLLFSACEDNRQAPEAAIVTMLKNVTQFQAGDTPTLPYKQDIKDPSIVNTTDRTIDILFNNAPGYLGGLTNTMVRFPTECMLCEPLQKYDQGFLFARRLYFSNDSAKYFKESIDIMDTSKLIPLIGSYGERGARTFNQDHVKLTMKYQGQSCNDADYVMVRLQFNDGVIEVNKLINASFFEFDLDNDGKIEQYLFGVRNCTQEFILLRINSKGL